MRKIKGILIFVLIGLMVSCKHEPDLVEPNITKDSITLHYVYDTILVEQGTFAKSQEPVVTGSKPISYTVSSNPSVFGQISIDSIGVINIDSTLAEGTYKITIVAGNVDGSFAFEDVLTVIVTIPPSAPNNFVYNPSSVTITFGNAATSATPTVLGSKPIVFSFMSMPSSSGLSIDSVTGIISASSSLAVNNYNITVTATNSLGNNSTEYKITVSTNPNLVSFATDIKPIIQNKCSSCHVPGGTRRDYTNYNNASSFASTIIDRINRTQGTSGFMPRGRTKLPQAQLDLIQQWVDEGKQP